MAIKKIGILVGGGPAPGINAVIGAATIEARNKGLEVVGFFDGFQWLSSDRFDPQVHAKTLQISDVARIHFDGGSILRTSRASLLDKKAMKDNPRATPNPELVSRVVANLRSLGVDGLLTIGGDDTALSARFTTDFAEGGIRLVHVPKTIDNDLPLPGDIPTFGFSTARYIGTHLVKNLMHDSETTGRWYICETMGRTAGWLSMAIGMAAGATISLIPEEFDDNTKFQHILDVLDGAILKRRVLGRPHGVAVIAEGLAYKLGDKEELEALLGREIPLDAAGHMRLAEVDLARLIKDRLTALYKERGHDLTVQDLEIGYELRSADPTPFDMGYCRSLGYFGIQLLLDDSAPKGAMAAIVNGNLEALDLHEMADPETNRTQTRVVDIRSDVYRIARAYMIRLEKTDLENPEMLSRLAAEARMSPEGFRKRFARAATRLSEGLPE